MPVLKSNEAPINSYCSHTFTSIYIVQALTE